MSFFEIKEAGKRQRRNLGHGPRPEPVASTYRPEQQGAAPQQPPPTQRQSFHQPLPERANLWAPEKPNNAAPSGLTDGQCRELVGAELTSLKVDPAFAGLYAVNPKIELSNNTTRLAEIRGVGVFSKNPEITIHRSLPYNLNSTALRFVVAHELAHYKHGDVGIISDAVKYLLRRAVEGLAFCVVAATWLPIIVFSLGKLEGLADALAKATFGAGRAAADRLEGVFLRHEESRADQLAAKVVGIGGAIDALLFCVVATGENRKSLTHPSFSDRIDFVLSSIN